MDLYTFLLKAALVAFTIIWGLMSVITLYLYSFHKVKLFNNKHKLTLGVVYTLIAWPHVLYHVLIS